MKMSFYSSTYQIFLKCNSCLRKNKNFPWLQNVVECQTINMVSEITIMVQDQYVHLVKSPQGCWGASHCHQQGSTKTYFLQATASMPHIPLLLPRHNQQAPRSSCKSCYKVISCTLTSHSRVSQGAAKDGRHSSRINNLEMLKITKKSHMKRR